MRNAVCPPQSVSPADLSALLQLSRRQFLPSIGFIHYPAALVLRFPQLVQLSRCFTSCTSDGLRDARFGDQALYLGASRYAHEAQTNPALAW
ncbi:uncharacterized protein N7496_000678 [Penicillium cataractarum]|uniref:Uncharacterized protein n=1 Tax=Penicillium cataractarum TaxID=2100454 RepID=A0A9W9VUR4_9EURO|nr:uncharacterized protein N7496_000678 [Penicillium cataractarum]KAJ5389610.1 hypothetical protein N7496_000678 [Penicillium cataractarum]